MRIIVLSALLVATLAGTTAAARPLVAVIDSGIARTTELQSVVVAEYDMAAQPARPPFAPRYDHGTMVATILNREAAGGVDIVSLRIDDPAGCPAGASPPCQPAAAPIADAVRKAVELGAAAINISLSLKDDPAIVAAIRAAARQGITIVLAAGNDGHNRPGNLDMAVAGYPHTVLVGATNTAGEPWPGTNRPDIVPTGYNYVWRLGVDVPTAAISGSAVTGTGTSFAAPIETARRLLGAPAGGAGAAGLGMQAAAPIASR